MTEVGWVWYLGINAAKIGSTAGFKAVLNVCVPGSGAIVDFAEALYCFSNGDIAGGVTNTVSGVADVCSAGVVGSVKELMKESAKKAVVDTAKNQAKSAAKEATKKVGEELAKQLAKGTITEGEKEVAKQVAKGAAKTAAKKATKNVGQKIAQEIAKGVVSDAVEEVLNEGGKITVANMLKNISLDLMSSGGNPLFYEMMKPSNVYQLTKEAAKTAAENELKKHTGKLFATGCSIEAVKGGVDFVLKKL